MANKTITGSVYVVADNVDTDQIIPAIYLNLVPTIPEEYSKLGSYAMVGLPDDYPPFIEEGTDKTPYPIIISGNNFGCGSSREHAPICLGAAGVKAVVSPSYARIFFRNAVSTGEVFPVESKDSLCDKFKTGDVAEIDFEANKITNQTSGESYELLPPGAVAPVIDAGGIFAYARQNGIIKKKD